MPYRKMPATEQANQSALKHMSTPVEQIKERLNIVDVVGQYVKLTKAGKNYKGLSPFTQEKTPSFFVAPDRNVYYCFSSGKGGDLFTFVQEMEGVDFRGALRILADRAGVELKAESREARDARERQYKLLEEATRIFEHALAQAEPAQEYLRERGLLDQTIKGWRLGYAVPGWRVLKDALFARGFQEHELEAAGLIKQGEKGHAYDRFRGRIMFPISDSAGRVVAFSARLFDTPDDGTEPPKYINSPETQLYDKSRALYGLDKAKTSIRKFNCSILVEGQMDVLLAHQAGYKNAVAASGTALSEAHLEQLARISSNVIMAFDADRAGIASAGRSTELALARGMDVKIAALPKGVDPADLIKEDRSAWRRVIREAKHVVDFYLDVMCEQEEDARKRELAVREVVLPFVARIQNRMDQAYFVGRIADRLSMSEEPVWEEVRRLAAETRSRDMAQPQAPSPQAGAKTAQHIPRSEALLRALVGIVWWQQAAPAPALDVSELQRRLAELERSGFEELAGRFESDREELMFQAEVLLGESAAPGEEIQEYLHALARERVKEAYEAALRNLRAAEQGGDREAADRFTDRCNRLRAHLAAFESNA